MNFCPKCQFMVYTKLNSDKKGLINYCRNCSWEGEYIHEQDNVCVYTKNYSNDFKALQSVTNKYILHDPTLPRISNIECINENCATNLKINSELSVKITSEHELEKTDLNDLLQENEFNLETVNLLQLNSNEYIVTFSDKDSMDRLLLLQDSEFTVSPYEKPNREIIFMKYDNANLKYLYMCSTCRTTWKTE